MIKGGNNDALYEHSLDHHVEFFSKAGSLMLKKGTFYGGETTALALFQGAFIAGKELAVKLMFWLRNCRGGAGNRSGFRQCLNWLATHDPEWVKVNMDRIPHWGRFDDLTALFDTPLEADAAMYWAEQIKKGHVLAAKWAKREMRPLQSAFKVNEAGLRKILVRVRSGHIVEEKMCGRRWTEIEYKHVPSVAMARYTSAFGRHDPAGFTSFKDKLAKGQTTVNAGALFPYDCLRTVYSGDQAIADAQFAALPNYMEGTDYRIFPIADCSGSMDTPVAGSVRMYDVALSLAFYCSDRLPKNSPFWRRFIEFSDGYNLINWSTVPFNQAVHLPQRHCGGTNIEATLNGMLETAEMFSVPQENMPNMLLILSDMQFNQHSDGNGKPAVEACMAKWEAAGYKAPAIVYWCLAGYAGQPATVDTKNVALVSGFSPSLMTAILGGTDFSPKAVMLRAADAYSINVPGGTITAIERLKDEDDDAEEEASNNAKASRSSTAARVHVANSSPRSGSKMVRATVAKSKTLAKAKASSSKKAKSSLPKKVKAKR